MISTLENTKTFGICKCKVVFLFNFKSYLPFLALTIPKYFINLHIHDYYHMCAWAGFKNDWNTNMTLFIESFHTFLLRDQLINIDVRSKWCKPETRSCIWFKSKMARALFFRWGGPSMLILPKDLRTWGLSILPAAYKQQKSFNHSGPKSKTTVFPRCPICDLSVVSLCIFDPFCVFNIWKCCC